ncbi:hypothetical protein GDO86_010542, partial [Hymenochirus boettgeri]
LSKKYGSVFTVHLGTQRTVVLCGYETVKDALVNHGEDFSARPEIPIFHDLTGGHGIVFSNGENWKVTRRFTLSTFRNFGMGKKLIENRINEECDFLLEKFKSYNGLEFENTIVINSAVANIIMSILLGHRFDYEDPTFHTLIHFLNENIRLVVCPMVMVYNTFPSLMRWLPGSHKSLPCKAVKVQDIFKNIIIKLKAELDINNQKNLIDAFLVKQIKEEKNNNGSHFHNDNLTILVFNMFIAGTITTSNTLLWGLHFMIRFPEIQQNVQKEIDKMIGSSPPRLEHRKLMPYTNAVIHEIQRFANVVPLNLPRSTSRDVSFKGYFLPKGTFVIPLLASVLNDKEHFERPNTFYPQHFLDPDGNFVKNKALKPFSIGKRSCIGENLARTALFLFFTRLLQNFTFMSNQNTNLDPMSFTGSSDPPLLNNICAFPRTETSTTIFNE